MKRLWLILACVLLVAVLATPAMAADMEIIFTADSVFDVGGTVSVDKGLTMDNITDNGPSECYNAYLEGNVQYFWYRDGVWDESLGNDLRITLTESHRGSILYCQAALYGDMDRTMQVGTVKSADFTVGKLPEITTTSIPNGTVNKEYYCKLECTDSDVTFELLQSSLPAGLTLTQHGEIEGTPTEAGFFHINVIVTDAYGTENTASFEFTIAEAAPKETTPAPEATKPEATAPKDTDQPAPEATAPSSPKEDGKTEHPEATYTPDALTTGADDAKKEAVPETPVLLIIVIALAVLLVGAVAVILLLVLSRKKKG